MNWFGRLFTRTAPVISAPPARETIHLVLKNPPPGIPATMANIAVTGGAYKTSTLDGITKTEYTLYAKGDALTLIELKAAVYWSDALASQLVERSTATQWLALVEACTSTKYLVPSKSDLFPEKATLIPCLAILSLHYSISKADEIGYESLSDFCRQTSDPDRLRAIAKAKTLGELLDSSQLPKELLTHLQNSVS